MLLEIPPVSFSISTPQEDACVQLLHSCPLLNYSVNASLRDAVVSYHTVTLRLGFQGAVQEWRLQVEGSIGEIRPWDQRCFDSLVNTQPCHHEAFEGHRILCAGCMQNGEKVWYVKAIPHPQFCQILEKFCNSSQGFYYQKRSSKQY